MERAYNLPTKDDLATEIISKARNDANALVKDHFPEYEIPFSEVVPNLGAENREYEPAAKLLHNALRYQFDREKGKDLKKFAQFFVYLDSFLNRLQKHQPFKKLISDGQKEKIKSTYDHVSWLRAMGDTIWTGWTDNPVPKQETKEFTESLGIAYKALQNRLVDLAKNNKYLNNLILRPDDNLMDKLAEQKKLLLDHQVRQSKVA